MLSYYRIILFPFFVVELSMACRRRQAPDTLVTPASPAECLGPTWHAFAQTTIDISEPQCIISLKSPRTFPTHLTLWRRERALP